MKKVIITLIAAAFVVIAIFVIPSDERSKESQDLQETRDPSTRPSDGLGRDDTPLTEVSCLDAGGTWNPCGSACRTNPEAICIELCVEYCECQGNNQCPSGYTCDDVVDGVGVCL
ncbi:hypothetical protein EPN81_03185 [Patescibacteria group bacterium]|nr:MAG: hypothetical protein EPN81_03185 [Patescibacteria group bacterium]